MIPDNKLLFDKATVIDSYIKQVHVLGRDLGKIMQDLVLSLQNKLLL